MHNKITLHALVPLTAFSTCWALFQKIDSPQNHLNVDKVRSSHISVHNNTKSLVPVAITTTNTKTKNQHIQNYDLPENKKLKFTAQKQQHIKAITMPSNYYGTVDMGSTSSLLLTINKKNPHNIFNRLVTATNFEHDIGRDSHASQRSQRDFNLSVSNNNLFSLLVMTGFYPNQILSYFLDLYNQNHLSKHVPSVTPRIPNIIHHVWFGSPFPQQYRHWRRSWVDKHPEWIDILWVDNPENYNEGTLITSYSELTNLISKKMPGVYVVPCHLVFPLFHQDFFEKTTNLGERSDIFRLDMLNRFGGLYVDTDFECIEPFDILNHTYDFYAGLAPLSMNKVQVANGLIASRPHHPILKAYQSEIADSSRLQHLGKIPGLFSGTPVVAATGPAPLTRAIVCAPSCTTDRNIIFPPSTFYAHRLTMREYTKAGNPFPPERFEDFPDNFALPLDSFAIHYWESSWNK